MNTFIPFNETSLKQYLSIRDGEAKLGETVKIVSEDIEAALKDEEVKIVVFGIPEDLGPRANLGIGGSSEAWESSLSKFLNMQSNQFLSGEKILIAGHVFCEDLLELASSLNPKNENDLIKLRGLVSKVDNRVADIVKKIKSHNKLAIAIGGGHNNSYGLIKGCSEVISKAINVINLDPHADFRPLEGRHSGNGFSYAKAEGLLDNYFVLGLHESYNSDYILKEAEKDIFKYVTYDNIVKGRVSFEKALLEGINYIKSNPCGIELDLDSIENMPSSASSPSGISVSEARFFLIQAIENTTVEYVHIAEGSPSLHTDGNHIIGKTIAYLITDCCKTYLKKF